MGPLPWPVAPEHAFAHQISRLSLGRRLRSDLTGWAQANGYNSDINSPDNRLQRSKYDLALQLLFCFEVRSLSERLVSSTPE